MYIYINYGYIINKTINHIPITNHHPQLTTATAYQISINPTIKHIHESQVPTDASQHVVGSPHITQHKVRDCMLFEYANKEGNIGNNILPTSS